MSLDERRAELANVNKKLKSMDDEARALLKGTDEDQKRGRAILSSRKFRLLRIAQDELKNYLRKNGRI